jgi:GTP pyrophosphokinase
VAGILADMKLDVATIITGLLHDNRRGYPDVPEQLETPLAGTGPTGRRPDQDQQISYADKEERQAENFRK